MSLNRNTVMIPSHSFSCPIADLRNSSYYIWYRHCFSTLKLFFYFFQKKCMQYWPEESGECGPFFIIIRHTEQCNNYVVRQMIIRKVCTTNSKHNMVSNETYKKLSKSSKQLQFSISNGIQTLCLDCTIIVQERNI